MDREKDSEQGKEQRSQRPEPRPWTQRTRGPLRFTRYTDTDGAGRPSIIYKFHLPEGQKELPHEAYEILQQMKLIDRGRGRGTGQHFTGLELQRNKRYGGRIWRLPDTPTGRTVAEIIDARLLELARRMEADEGRGR